MADEDANQGHDDAGLAGEWYADRFHIGHNAFEFKVDCGHEQDGEMTVVYFRVISNPANARELFRQLGIGLLRHADRFGRDDGDGAGGGEA